MEHKRFFDSIKQDGNLFSIYECYECNSDMKIKTPVNVIRRSCTNKIKFTSISDVTRQKTTSCRLF